MPDLRTGLVVFIFVVGQLSGSESLPYRSLGCWKDTGERAIPILEGTDSRLDGQYRERQNAVWKCYQVALSRSFPVFSVQHGGQCFGSANGTLTYNKYGPSSDCEGDGEGGAWANEVYKIIAPIHTKRLGCWKDTSDRAIPTLEGTDSRLDGEYWERENAIEKCYQVALSRNFSVFAVQAGGWCVGSTDGLSTYNKYGPSTDCGGDGEGGSWANEVYKIIVTEYRSLGCWADTGDRAVPVLDGTDPRLDATHHRLRNNSIGKCYQVALSRGFPMFAVQDGGQCLGSMDGLNTYRKYGHSIACEGEGKGGPWANDVYEIRECESRRTDDQYMYRWVLSAIGESPFTFEVQANNDAHVALSSQNRDLDDMYEIVIGGWDNTQSAIRRSKGGTNQASNSTPGILSPTESRGFWISWTVDGTIRVGRRGETTPFLQWTDPEPLEVAYAGFTTGWGSTGQWRLCYSYTTEQVSPAGGDTSESSGGLSGFHIAGIVIGSNVVVFCFICHKRNGQRPNNQPNTNRAPPQNQPSTQNQQSTDAHSLTDLSDSDSNTPPLTPRLRRTRSDPIITVSQLSIDTTGVDNMGVVYDDPPSYPEASTAVVVVQPSAPEPPPPSYANISSDDPPPPSYEDAVNMDWD